MLLAQPTERDSHFPQIWNNSHRGFHTLYVFTLSHFPIPPLNYTQWSIWYWQGSSKQSTIGGGYVCQIGGLWHSFFPCWHGLNSQGNLNLPSSQQSSLRGHHLPVWLLDRSFLMRHSLKIPALVSLSCTHSPPNQAEVGEKSALCSILLSIWSWSQQARAKISSFWPLNPAEQA